MKKFTRCMVLCASMSTSLLIAHEAALTLGEPTEAATQHHNSNFMDVADHAPLRSPESVVDNPSDEPTPDLPKPPPNPSFLQQLKERILHYLIEHKMVWVVQEPARHFEEHGSRYQVGGTILSSAAVGALITYLIMKRK